MTVSTRDFKATEDLPIIAKFFDEARDLVGHTQGFLHAGAARNGLGRAERRKHDDPAHRGGLRWFTGPSVYWWELESRLDLRA
jgi:hypothetical protein